MADKKDCTCNDWIENIKTINDALIFNQIRSGSILKIKQFIYCPYCGKEIK